MLVAFDVLATNAQDLQRLMELLTERIAFLTHGGEAPHADAKLPPWIPASWGRTFILII